MSTIGATCDWCLRGSPVHTIRERLWRFWKIISAEAPTLASRRNICERCESRYEEFSAYVETCKADASVAEGILAPGAPSIDVTYHPLIKDQSVTEDKSGSSDSTASYARSGDFKGHVRARPGAGPFKCSTCDKGFNRRGGLKTHLYVHTGEKPSKCSVCGKTFTRSDHLKSHMRIHTNEEPFKCLVCDRNFKTSDSSKRHMRLHTGEKPFKCPVCNYKFNQSGALGRHMRSHVRSL